MRFSINAEINIHVLMAWIIDKEHSKKISHFLSWKLELWVIGVCMEKNMFQLLILWTISDSEINQMFLDEFYSQHPKKNCPANKTDFYQNDNHSSSELLDWKDYGLEKNRGFRYVLVVLD